MNDKIDNAATLVIEKITYMVSDDLIIIGHKIKTVDEYRKFLVSTLTGILEMERPANKPSKCSNFTNTYKVMEDKSRYKVFGKISDIPERWGNIACAKFIEPKFCMKYKTCMVCSLFNKDVYIDKKLAKQANSK